MPRIIPDYSRCSAHNEITWNAPDVRIIGRQCSRRIGIWSWKIWDKSTWQIIPRTQTPMIYKLLHHKLCFTTRLRPVGEWTRKQPPGLPRSAAAKLDLVEQFQRVSLFLLGKSVKARGQTPGLIEKLLLNMILTQCSVLMKGDCLYPGHPFCLVRPFAQKRLCPQLPFTTSASWKWYPHWSFFFFVSPAVFSLIVPSWFAWVVVELLK